MNLKLDANVVYAILAAIVILTLIVYTTRIIRIRAATPKLPPYEPPVDPHATAPWPALTQEQTNAVER